jgi:hypothetical protein
VIDLTYERALTWRTSVLGGFGVGLTRIDEGGVTSSALRLSAFTGIRFYPFAQREVFEAPRGFWVSPTFTIQLLNQYESAVAASNLAMIVAGELGYSWMILDTWLIAVGAGVESRANASDLDARLGLTGTASVGVVF